MSTLSALCGRSQNVSPAEQPALRHIRSQCQRRPNFNTIAVSKPFDETSRIPKRGWRFLAPQRISGRRFSKLRRIASRLNCSTHR